MDRRFPTPPLPAPIGALLAVLALAGCALPAEAAERRARPACVPAERDVIALEGPWGARAAARIDGQPAVLEVSTGLRLSSLQPETVQRLGLPEDPRAQSGYATPAGRVTRQNVRLRSLRLGGREWTAPSLAVRPFPILPGAPVYDGVIGGDLLRDSELEIDLRGRRAAIRPVRDCLPGDPPWTVGGRAPLLGDGGGAPVVTLRVNGQAVRARIASGDNATSMKEGTAARLRLDRPTGRRSTVYGSDPVGRRGREFRLDEVALGEEALRGFPVTVVPDEMAGSDEMVLGQDWLALRRVLISYTRRQVFLEARLP